MVIARGNRRFGDERFQMVIACRLTGITVRTEMLVRIAILVNVLRSTFVMFVHMDDTQTVVFVSQARRRPRSVAKRK
jgi:hypothetical protein